MVNALLVLKTHFSQKKFLSVCNVVKEATTQIQVTPASLILLVLLKLLSIKKLNFVNVLLNIPSTLEDSAFLATCLSIGIQKKNPVNNAPIMNITILLRKVVLPVL